MTNTAKTTVVSEHPSLRRLKAAPAGTVVLARDSPPGMKRPASSPDRFKQPSKTHERGVAGDNCIS